MVSATNVPSVPTNMSQQHGPYQHLPNASNTVTVTCVPGDCNKIAAIHVPSGRNCNTVAATCIPSDSNMVAATHVPSDSNT
eukprot:scaffold62466_cov20-Tisochrysis_lutea.AAC.1